MRRVYFSGNVSELSCSKLIEDFNTKIESVEKDRNDCLLKYGVKPKEEQYELYIQTHGGSAYHCFGVYDYLKSLDIDLSIISMGFIASAGISMFLSRDERYCYANSTFLIHGPSSIALGTIPDVEESLEVMKMANDMQREIITTRTKITKRQFDNVLKSKKDWWIRADEALNLGLVTGILS